jgi:hypothetical protein
MHLLEAESLLQIVKEQILTAIKFFVYHDHFIM